MKKYCTTLQEIKNGNYYIILVIKEIIKNIEFF
jgi:hypothetical protein